jgi:hypothetical protein
MELQVLLTGGFGNQVLQYLAGQYLKETVGLKTVNFVLTPYLKENLRSPDLIKCISKQPIEIKRKIRERAASALVRYISSRYKDRATQLSARVCEQIEMTEGNLTSGTKISALEVAEQQLKLITMGTNKKLRVNINGFWQDPRPYLGDLKQLTSDFNIPEESKKTPYAPGEYIAIHVRRGDYCENLANAIEYGKRHSAVQFILAALTILPSTYKTVPLVLVTDDKTWCKLWCDALGNKERKATVISNKDPLADWHTIQQAKLTIISNSTFSFTAALLNNQCVDEKLRCIMPTWYNRSTTMESKGWTSIPGSLAI